MFHSTCNSFTWPRISETRDPGSITWPRIFETRDPSSVTWPRISETRGNWPRGPQPHRRGVTLVEVMFAIGIVSVGLLGVLLVVPLAGNRAARGFVADGADRVGRNAIREFEIRSMAQPNTWTRLKTETGTGSQQYVAFPSIVTGTAPGHTTISSRSFCIDPLFIATHFENADYANTSTPVPEAVEFFPYYEMTDVARETRMQRISLQTQPVGATGMSLAQAISVFMSGDDLVFNLSPDPTEPPIQNWGENDTQRQSEGRFTWMATLTPIQDTLIDGSNSLAQNTDLYLLSIVVFHRRDMTMTMQVDTPSIEGPDNERLVEVASFDGAGYGGGEVVLRTYERTTPSNTTAQHYPEDLTLRNGDWLMLSAKVGVPPGPPLTHPVHFFRWYRVQSADAIEELPSGEYIRSVSLQGTDWDRIILTMAQFPGANMVTQATLMNNVVAVYEKTIRLETSSLWTVQ
jgi:prepilin-type N-terminal cleavage/methylation domain-containing protein